MVINHVYLVQNVKIFYQILLSNFAIDYVINEVHMIQREIIYQDPKQNLNVQEQALFGAII